MTPNSPEIPDSKKLTISYKLEPGCLGPTGETMIVDFCQFVAPKISSIHGEFTLWQIEPRFDKTIAEIRYFIGDKMLTEPMAGKYLGSFSIKIDEFEDEMNEILMHSIDEYLAS